jgi:histidinol dehydrogenase
MKIVASTNLPAGFFDRPLLADDPAVRAIVADVRAQGDVAVRRYTLRFDGVDAAIALQPQAALEQAWNMCPESVRLALQEAAGRIRRMAMLQKESLRPFACEIAPGVTAEQRLDPLERVGVYVPGGRHALVSSLLMGAIPAQVAGVGAIAVCTPPRPDGSVHQAVLAAARLLGIDELYAVGGAQAIAALAWGTATIPAVVKIVGPGNRYVTLAKRDVYGRVGIDFLAGPSEVLILADQSADARLLAADLLAQAEHDPLAEAVLLTDSADLAARVSARAQAQLASLPTAATARAALAGQGLIVVVREWDEAVAIANRKAPEHVELHVATTRMECELSGRLRNFGSLFCGRQAAEVFGDYNSGLNHVLPTAGAARYCGGLGVRDFLKVQTVLRMQHGAAAALAPGAARLARVEGLEAHARAAEMRAVKQSARSGKRDG